MKESRVVWIICRVTILACLDVSNGCSTNLDLARQIMVLRIEIGNSVGILNPPEICIYVKFKQHTHETRHMVIFTYKAITPNISIYQTYYNFFGGVTMHFILKVYVPIQIYQYK
jgi:hypothetical protein